MKKNKIKSAQKSIAFCALYMSAILFLTVLCSFCKNKAADNELAYESNKYTPLIATIEDNTSEKVFNSFFEVQNKNEINANIVSDTEREIIETNGTTDSFSGLYLTSSFSTDISSSSENRKHNIYLAARAVDNTLLLPNSCISFNDIVGERSVKRGYKTSKVIEKNRYVDGVGGGVCQVSTTLYVAALMSNLQVVECHSHSIPSSYVSYSMDSTVAYDYLDLKIYNPSNAVYAIKTTTDNDRLTINIYSTEKSKYKTILKSEVIESIDPEKEVELKTLPDGIEPIFDENGIFIFIAKRVGIKSRLVAKYYDENGFAFSKVLRKDYYQEQPRVIYKQNIDE